MDFLQGILEEIRGAGPLRKSDKLATPHYFTNLMAKLFKEIFKFVLEIIIC
jgi:hypothetical protein